MDAFLRRREAAPRLPSQEYVTISDEEGEAHGLDPPSLPQMQQNATATATASTNPNVDAGRYALVAEHLHSLGVWPQSEWLISCMDALGCRQPGFRAMPIEAQAERCFGQFLLADLNVVGDSALPPDVHTLHATELPGPFVLQVDEIVDIGSSIRDRYKERSAGIGIRCLKLSMTDGVQRVFGIEYRAIPHLEVLSPAGLKVVIRNVVIRRGLFMLVPEVIDILGGFVEPLEAARIRMVQQVNKPPRGNRARRGSVIPKLAEKAAIAAWPSETPNVATFEARRSNNEQYSPPVAHQELRRHQLPISSTGERGTSSMHRDDREGLEPRHDQQGLQDSAVFRQSFQTSSAQTVPIQLQQTPASIISRLSLNARRGSDSKESGRQNLGSMQTPIRITETYATDCCIVPFTYLALLKVRASSTDAGLVQGKIKCVLTGVKEFHFKDREEFKLVVHIDDGSLIVEAVIEHHVVQERVGYSPMEVGAALSGSDKQNYKKMKESMRKFQIFLTKFEGYADVEFRPTYSNPVVVALCEAFGNSDACLLLDRVQHSNNSSHPTIQPSELHPNGYNDAVSG